MKLNMKVTTHEGEKGYFMAELELEKLKGILTNMQEQIDIAKGESKYKLKKLSKMIERKDAKIARLIEDEKDRELVRSRSDQLEISVNPENL